MSTASKTVLANKALSFLGQKPITDITTVDTANDRLTVVQLHIDDAIEEFIRDFNFSPGTKTADLILLCEDPTDNWQFAYYRPSDCLRFRKILSAVEEDDRETAVDFREVTEPSATAVNITAATQSTSCTITTSSALTDGQIIAVAAVVGMTQLNGNSYIVSESDEDAKTCVLVDLSTGEDVDSSAYTAYTSGGTATPTEHWRIYANVESPIAEYSTLANYSLWQKPSFPTIQTGFPTT